MNKCNFFDSVPCERFTALQAELSEALRQKQLARDALDSMRVTLNELQADFDKLKRQHGELLTLAEQMRDLVNGAA